jgi:hypothetical protein
MKYLRNRNKLNENSFDDRVKKDLFINEVIGKIEFPEVELSIACDSINDILGGVKIGANNYYYSNLHKKFGFNIDDIDDVYNLAYALLCDPIMVTKEEYDDMSYGLISVVDMIKNKYPEYEIRYKLERIGNLQLKYQIFIITDYFISPRNEMDRIADMLSDKFGSIRTDSIYSPLLRYKYLGRKDLTFHFMNSTKNSGNSSDFNKLIKKIFPDEYFTFSSEYTEFESEYMITYKPTVAYQLKSNII